MLRLLLLLLSAPLVFGATLLSAPFGVDVVPGKFIVTLKQDASESTLFSALNKVQAALGLPQPRFLYNMKSFKGFTLDSAESLLVHILHLDEIEFIEPETTVRTSTWIQPNAPYGLSRISHRTSGSTDYVFDDPMGDGTYSYVIDTGIYTDHPDFGGRASFGANFAGDGSTADGNGHGTHCAGTIGSNSFGVAKRTNLIAVKVLDASGSGSSSGVIAGLEWATNDVVTHSRQGKSVANLSLGGPRVGNAMDRAVKAAADQGLFMAVAAGNSGEPASGFSPASEKAACTVGAIDSNNKRPSFSNYGKELAVFAPGVDILSTWNDGGTNVLSGTSMATPHVAGLGAYILSFGQMEPAALCRRIKDTASSGVSSKGTGSPDRIAYNGAA